MSNLFVCSLIGNAYQYLYKVDFQHYGRAKVALKLVFTGNHQIITLVDALVQFHSKQDSGEGTDYQQAGTFFGDLPLVLETLEMQRTGRKRQIRIPLS